MSESRKHSYGQILKSSALIGGSSAINLAIGALRTKIMATILGPAGIGLLGLYGSVTDLTRSVAGMGINSSGVRQIAEAVGSGDEERIARTVTALRRVAFCTGILGALLLLALCKPASWLTFGDFNHTCAIACLAIAVFFGDISGGQSALVQGMRRIADLAKMNVLGALFGTIFSVCIVYFFYRRGEAERGVVPSLICVAGMSILISWWYARKIQVRRVTLTLRQIADEADSLLKMGVVFMASGLMTLGMGYLIPVMVSHKFGREAAGCYFAAWYLGNYYVSFILQAMGADFYPRLTAVASDHQECNRLVNEQVEVGLLLAGPGLLATLTFAPLVIQIFYSSQFAPAAEILRWFCLGMMMRVASWPMAYVLVSRGERKLYFFTEFLGNGVFVFFVWAGLNIFGLKGSGIAFFSMYVAYGLIVYFIVRRLIGFRWLAANRRLALIFLPAVTLVFVSRYFLPNLAAIAVGTLLTVVVGIYSLKMLCTLVPLERFPGPARKMILFFKLASPDINHPI